MTTTTRQRKRSAAAAAAAGFTLVELLVAISIVVLLIGLLIPTVSTLRNKARVADVQNQIATLSNAIQQYQSDHRAYPGPVSNQQIRVAGATGVRQVNSGQELVPNMTMAENLTLGVMGGLQVNSSTGAVEYDPALVGQGARGLGAVGTGRKPYPAYYTNTNDLSDKFLADRTVITAGKYGDEADADIEDSAIPEILDRFGARMPILYLRARPGANVPGPASGWNATNNPVVQADAAAGSSTATNVADRDSQYDLSQILAYTESNIGEGKQLDATDYKGNAAHPQHGLRSVDPDAVLREGDKDAQGDAGRLDYPFNAYPYLQNPSMPGTARQKDGFILISAGPDRIYGTKDDITNFGSVTND